MSGLPRTADISRPARHFAFAPETELPYVVRKAVIDAKRSVMLAEWCTLAHANSAAAKAGAATGSAQHKKTSAGEAPTAVDTAREQQRAMVIGMLPMAIEPGQNAPLGRAVMGGLVFATCATLFLVPTLFASLHGPADRHRKRTDEAPVLLPDLRSVR